MIRSFARPTMLQVALGRATLAHVAGPEVAVGGEFLARLLRHAPVAGEDVGPLAPRPRRPRPAATAAPAASTTRIDTPGSGWPTVPPTRGAVERIRRVHPGFGHPVAFEDRVPGALAKASKVSASSGAEPETNSRIAAAGAARERRLGEQPRVERGHAHHHGRARQQRRALRRASNFGSHSMRAPGQQHAVDRDEQAVHVVDRQRVEQHVAAREAPVLDQRRRVRGEVAVRQHRALRAAGGARGVEDRGEIVRLRRHGGERRAAGRCARASRRSSSVRTVAPPASRAIAPRRSRPADDHARLGVGEEIARARPSGSRC